MKTAVLPSFAISNLICEFHTKKEALEEALLALVPDSLPQRVRETIILIAVKRLLDGKRSSHGTLPKVSSYGFETLGELKRQMGLLQESWKNQIRIEILENPNEHIEAILMFEPA